jgi:electron transport complex protein RnfD
MEGLIVSSSPHTRTDENTRSIMLDMLIALSFPLAVAVYFFGWRSLTLAAFSITCCIIFEYLYRKLLKKPGSLGDFSAPVTGMLLCFVLPVSVPYWIVAIGAFFAIVVVKQLYGGLGKNFLNPTLAARAFLAGFPALTVFVRPLLEERIPILGSFDAAAVFGETPLSYLKDANRLRAEGLPKLEFEWSDLFLGQIPGNIGEVSTALLLLGGLYLVIRKVITPRIPAAFLGTVALLTYFFPLGGVDGFENMLFHLLSGGLVLGAVFMATDPSTGPVTSAGQWMFGIGCGFLTVFFRTFGEVPEGVWYAILLMNALVWTLDRIGIPRRFGRRVRDED